MPRPANDPEYHLTLRQADQARGDFAAILDELDFCEVAALAGTHRRVARTAVAGGLRQCVGATRGRRVAAGTMRAAIEFSTAAPAK
jgi:hypothetical protein